MKIVMYTLNADGTVPSSIHDGGYLAVSNNNPSPQNLTLIGLTTDPSLEANFLTKESLVQYILDNNLSYTNQITQEEVPAETIAQNIWDKLGGD